MDAEQNSKEKRNLELVVSQTNKMNNDRRNQGKAND